MKKTAIILICVTVLSLLASCTAKSADDSPDAAGTLMQPPDGNASGTAGADDAEAPRNYRLNGFDDEFIAYLCLNGYDSSDFLISPSAFRAGLCLAAAGARSNTRAELMQAANFSGMDALAAWYSGLPEAVAASVWCNADMLGTFSDSYVSDITETYHADARSAASGELTQALNDWIAQESGSKALRVSEDISGASAVLLSTLNLQTAWANAFSDTVISERVFVGEDGKEHRMPFMEQTGEYLYAEEIGGKILAVPMEDNLSFVCFSGSRTGQFERMAELHPETVHAVLPVFELASAFDATDLTGFLLQRGLNDAVSSHTANYYNMCSDADWFMQEVMQTVTVSVNQNGITSASQVRAAPDKAESDGGDAAKEFIADSAFSFAVFSDFGTERQHMLLYGQMINGG